MLGRLPSLTRIAVACAAAVCVAGFPAPAAAKRSVRAASVSRPCAYGNTPATAASSAAMRTAVVCLINQQRARRGLPALRDSSLLDRSAQGWTNSMVLSGIFSHGLDFAARITAVGFVWQDAGENIATGFPTPASVVSAWMASKDHCENILNPVYTKVGTGISRHPVGSWASTASTWTQDFALPMSSRAPSHNYGPQHGCPY